MTFQFTALAVLPLVAAGMAAIIAWYAIRLRPNRGANTVAWLALASLVWSLGYALEIAATDLSAKLFWAKVQYIGIAAVPLCWLIFALEYAGYDRWLTRRNVALLSVIPVSTVLLAFTTESHGLILSTFSFDPSGGPAPLTVGHGAWFWVYWLYSQLLVLSGTVVLIRTISVQRAYRQQAELILIAALLPWIGNFLYVTGLNPLAPLDLTPFAFVLSEAVIVLGMSRFRLLALTPIAQAAVIESMSDSMFVIDTRNNLVDLNPAAQRLLGVSAGQVIGQSIAIVFQAWGDLVEGYRDVAEARIEIDEEGEDNRRHFYELRLSPLNNRRGQAVGRVLLVRDITELVEAREEAMEANRLKSQLLARVSHELRTPLSAILGYAELLYDGSFGLLSDRQQQAVSEVMGSTQELTNLVNELLDSAQLEAHALKLYVRPFDPIEMLQRVENTMAVLARNKGLRLTTTAALNLPATLLGDESRLRQILINLIGNAIKFTENGSVQARLYRVDEQRWAMEVSDTGPGIPEEAQRYVFEPFRQVDGAITREYRGTGLGLSIVQSLIELMGGSIRLESEVGRGSTFILTLPLQPRQENT